MFTLNKSERRRRPGRCRRSRHRPHQAQRAIFAAGCPGQRYGVPELWLTPSSGPAWLWAVRSAS